MYKPVEEMKQYKGAFTKALKNRGALYNKNIFFLQLFLYCSETLLYTLLFINLQNLLWNSKLVQL